VEIRAVNIGSSRMNDFTMNVSLTQPKLDDEKKPPVVKPAAKG
jgi:hypothetical protein